MMKDETDRAFCFFQIGFHEAKWMCQNCYWFSRCRRDAGKMRRIFGRLLWEGGLRTCKFNPDDYPELKNRRCKNCD